MLQQMPDTFGIFIFRDVCEKPFKKKKKKRRERKKGKKGKIEGKSKNKRTPRGERAQRRTRAQLDGIGRALTVIRTKAHKGRWSAKK